MKQRRVVVTGIGIVNPSGIGKDVFWRNMTDGQLAIRPITRFDTGKYPIKVAGEIQSFAASDYVPKRMLNKTDLFTHYALAASEMALQDADIRLEELESLYRVGVFFGNNAGGWDICERGFYEMYNDGPALVNPWQATAWFPTAPQGYITIRYGIKGTSKSFVADRASGASALCFGVRSILSGQNELVISGGTEAPITRFGTICYYETGQMSGEKNPEQASKPFDPGHSGAVIGEGSTVLILEEEERAVRRGARIYGTISGYASTTGRPDDSDSLARCMRSTIEKSGLRPDDIGLILPEGSGIPQDDHVEAAAIQAVWDPSGARPAVTVPKSMYGHLYGAATATDVACGILSMESGILPPTRGVDAAESLLPIITHKQHHSGINSILINSRAREGVNVSLILSSYEGS
jgi:3-oxoacyl-[acyl-carrier-protein] synthase II